MPKKKRSGLCVGVLEWWHYYETCRPLEVSTSPCFAYLGRDNVDGRQPNSSTT